MKPINIGLIGFGTVGSGVAPLLTEQQEVLARRLGSPLILKKVADLDLDRPRPVALPPEVLTTRAEDILEHPEIDIVVELIGGTTAAREYVMAAIARGKHVVTANKALLAHHGNDLLAAAAAAGVEVAFEASVCGGIPIILALRQALAEAQAQGFAEADPTLDVEGIDTAHKLAILMSLAYGSQLDLESIAVEGISRLNPLDLQFAGEFGYCLKLLAITRDDGHRVEARVHPTLVPRTHMLANVNGAMNAVYLTGDAVGPILLYGQGAGMMPTASAVVSDLIDLARNLNRGVPGRVPALGWESALNTRRLIKPINDLVTNYYLRFSALDRPGVLSQVSGILGKHNISIAAVIQKGRELAGTVPIVMITHEAREADARQAMAEIDQLPIVSPPTVFYRIEAPPPHAAQIWGRVRTGARRRPAMLRPP